MKLINNELVETTAEDLAQIEIDKANFVTQETAREEAETAKATAKASGNTKLLALGLTQAEATALTGYTPSED